MGPERLTSDREPRGPNDHEPCLRGVSGVVIQGCFRGRALRGVPGGGPCLRDVAGASRVGSSSSSSSSSKVVVVVVVVVVADVVAPVVIAVVVVEVVLGGVALSVRCPRVLKRPLSSCP
eukprot:7785602-Pyramimonas_sp.AAC.1